MGWMRGAAELVRKEEKLFTSQSAGMKSPGGRGPTGAESEKRWQISGRRC